jgi:hypothetical protein
MTDQVDNTHSTTPAAEPLALRLSEGLGAWSPIDTAPDMPAFSAIVASPMADGGYFVEEAWWDYERREWWPANVDWTDAHGEQVFPAYWMNLPAPPQSA